MTEDGHSFNAFFAIALYLPAATCCLLMIFANSLDPDQARQNVRPDLDPNCSTL